MITLPALKTQQRGDEMGLIMTDRYQGHSALPYLQGPGAAAPVAPVVPIVTNTHSNKYVKLCVELYCTKSINSSLAQYINKCILLNHM